VGEARQLENDGRVERRGKTHLNVHEADRERPLCRLVQLQRLLTIFRRSKVNALTGEELDEDVATDRVVLRA
jgi:hypothetical protein